MCRELMKMRQMIKMGDARERGKGKVLSQWGLKVVTCFILYTKLDPL